MKITVNETMKSTYPWVGKYHTGLIVLFTDSGRGACLVMGKHDHYVGIYRDDWFESDFKPITGTITIECP